jgi:hypothetical protein
MGTAQSKTEMQATIARLTAQNDSLLKVDRMYDELVDSLHVLTGVDVDNLDTVRTALARNKATRAVTADSLVRVNSRNALLRIQLDSLSGVVTRMRTDSTAMAAQLVTAVAAQAPGAATPTMSRTDQLMKLNGMLEQGLISKEEFLKLKTELMAK